MAELLRDVIPSQIQLLIGGIVSGFGAVLSYLLGWNDMMDALLCAMVADYVSGVIAAYLRPENKKGLDSRKGFRGIVKKVMILLVVSLAHSVDVGTGQDFIQTL